MKVSDHQHLYTVSSTTAVATFHLWGYRRGGGIISQLVKDFHVI